MTDPLGDPDWRPTGRPLTSRQQVLRFGSWHGMNDLKGTVSPDYKCLEVISITSPLLGHVTPDIKNFFNSSFNF